MERSDFYSLSNSARQSNAKYKYLIIILCILLGLLCLGGFVFTSIYWNTNSSLQRDCPQNQTQEYVLCFVRAVIDNARRTQWDRYVLVSLLLLYASVFFQMVVETTRTNVTGLLGQMVIQTMCIIFGIGVSFPILFLSGYIHFYQLKHQTTKSSVPIYMILTAFIYAICIIIIPTYLISFISNEFLHSIMSIILLVSPLGFALVTLPFRLLSSRMNDCCRHINSHRLIVQCQIILFIISSPLFFFTLVALIEHWSFNLFKQSYVTDISNIINPTAIIWTIDYTSLVLGLIIFICINEYLFNDYNNQSLSLKIGRIIAYFICAIIFLIAPCLTFPLYIAWKEYYYIESM
jgi:hypothetical protein